MIKRTVGTPVVGYVSLTNATPAADVPLYVIAGSGTAYVLASTERLVLDAVLFSTNDTAGPLVQLTDKAATPKILCSAYVTNTQPNAPIAFTNDVLGQFGQTVRAVCAAITAAKTIEVTFWAHISRT